MGLSKLHDKLTLEGLRTEGFLPRTGQFSCDQLAKKRYWDGGYIKREGERERRRKGILKREMGSSNTKGKPARKSTARFQKKGSNSSSNSTPYRGVALPPPLKGLGRGPCELLQGCRSH